MAVIGNSVVARRMLEVITAVSTLAEYRSWYPSHNSTTYKTLLFYPVFCLLSSEAVFPEFYMLLCLKILTKFLHISKRLGMCTETVFITDFVLHSTTYKTLLFYQVFCLLSSEAVFPEFYMLLCPKILTKFLHISKRLGMCTETVFITDFVLHIQY